MSKKTMASWPGRGGDLNPFIGIFVTSLEKVGYDVVSINQFPPQDLSNVSAVVIHWPQFIYSDSMGIWAKVATLLKFIALLAQLKRHGTRIIWLCHDLHPHDWDELKWKALWWPTLRAMFLMSDGIITLSPGTRDLVEQRYSGWIRGRLGWSWHPQYDDVLPGELVRTEARVSLGISKHVKLIGFFGQLRAQKGVEDLISAFSQTTDPEVHLLIAGPPSSAVSVSENIVAAEQRDQRIHAIVRKLEDDELSNLVSACDLCVFPYRQYTHSGAMIYSLSAHKRILTPRTPFSESLAEALPDWVDLYEGTLTAPKLLASAERETPDTPPDLSSFSATALAEKVVEFAGTQPPGTA